MRIAVVGAGISGLVSAYTLQQKHEVTLFEAKSYLGGHTATVDIEFEDESLAIDTGFIVFNNKTYPNFIQFLDKLGVSWKNTEMSFSVSDPKGKFEYNGNNLNTLFSDRRNLIRPHFYRFISEILRFNRICKKLNETQSIPGGLSLQAFLDLHGFNKDFRNYYLLPMAAAIWSASYSDVVDFSLAFFVTFFANHGLLNVNDRPQWHVINGGSREYVRALLRQLTADIRLDTPVTGVLRKKTHIEIETSKGLEAFDEVVFASHSDQTLKMLKDPSPDEREILSRLYFQKNQVTLHTDKSLLPKNELAWASWNYRIQREDGRDNWLPSVSYNMNILQGLRSKRTYVVSLNQDKDIAPDKVIRKFNYSHPVFSTASEEVKKRRPLICGNNRTHFCGAYWYNGFHEDGVRSALDIANRFGLSL